MDNKRVDQLFRLGMRFNGDSYIGTGEISDFNVHHTDILCDSDQQWNRTIKSLTEEAKRRGVYHDNLLNSLEITLGNKGYKEVVRSEHGIAYKNDTIEIAVILIFKYGDTDASRGYDLQEELNKQISYTKACIGVIMDAGDVNEEEMMKSMFFYIHIPTSFVDIIPGPIKKEIVAKFKKMNSSSDEGIDYKIHPYKDCDGLTVIEYLEYVSTAKEDFVVGFPACFSSEQSGYLKYISSKILNKVEMA